MKLIKSDSDLFEAISVFKRATEKHTQIIVYEFILQESVFYGRIVSLECQNEVGSNNNTGGV
jgi:hypothetical protein